MGPVNRLVVPVLLLSIIITFTIHAQDESERSYLARSYQEQNGSLFGKGLGLLNPGNFSMSHSYTMAYSTGNGQSKMTGLYMNSMNIKISDPLDLTVHVGYVHQPFAGNNQGMSGLNNMMLSGFELTYQPKKNMFLKIEYGTVPYNSNYWYGW